MATKLWSRVGSPLPKLGGGALGAPKRRIPQPTARRPREVKMRPPRQMNYYQIRAAVFAAIAMLGQNDQAQIPMLGTLPEIMVAYALVKLGYHFQCQNNISGGRLHLGGAVVDFKVFMGGKTVVIRVQGTWWHSSQSKKYQDFRQMMRLQALGYRVVDLQEADLYQAWSDGNFLPFVENQLLGAA